MFIPFTRLLRVLSLVSQRTPDSEGAAILGRLGAVPVDDASLLRLLLSFVRCTW